MEQKNIPPTLAPHHREEWERSAVDAAIIERNVWTVTDAAEVDRLLNRNSKRRWKHSTHLVPGWAVAGVNPKDGDRTFKGCQFKPDNPPTDPETGKPRKYLTASGSPTAPLFLEVADPEYWQKTLFDLTRPLIITEGAKKAGAGLSQGLATISLPGVATGQKLGRLKAELASFCRYGRRIYLAFDRDILVKVPVRKALHNLGRLLAEKGATVYVVAWDDQLKGLDDWLASGGRLIDGMAQAQTLEEWRAEPEPENLEQGEPCKLAARFRMVEERIGDHLRWNSLTSRPEYDGRAVDLDDLRIYLALRHNIEIPLEDCSAIVSLLSRKKQFSPVVEYLKSVATGDPPPDGDSPYIDGLASRYLGSDKPLHSAYLRKTLISAVARAFQPGCKVDSVCILAGGQGVGKSSFWRILGGDWFDDSVGSSSDKDERLKLHQCWIIEWAELESVFRRKDVSATKAFITTQVDQLRPPYGRAVKEFPRPSIFVGSTNFDQFLADPTGNRRYWVIPINIPAIPLQQLQAERDQIWGAVTRLYLAGENWQLPAELLETAKEESRDYEWSDPWETPILQYVEGKEKVKVEDILTEVIKLDIDRHDRSAQMRVANLLKSNGWTTKRLGTGLSRARFWISPKVAEQVVHVVQPNVLPTETPAATATQLGTTFGTTSGTTLGQPPEKCPKSDATGGSGSAVDNVDNLDNLFPKSSPTQVLNLSKEALAPEKIYSLGQKVRIIGGRFAGKLCIVQGFKGEKVGIKADTWYVVQYHLPSNLQPVEEC